jgi:hypothetical protein
MEFFSTFGGSTVSCAAGRAVLDVVLQEELQMHASRVGDWLRTRLAQLGASHHIGLESPDVDASAAIIEARPARKSYTGLWQLLGTTRHKLQVYDPDGSRTEIMLPSGPRQSSTVPPIR